MKLDAKRKQLITYASAIIANVAVLGVLLAELSDRPVAALLWLASAAVGWTLGVLASPYSKQETRQFQGYGRILGGVVTGFAVAKIDRIFEAALDAGVFLHRDALLAASGATVAVLTTAIAVYVARAYTDD